MRSLVVSSLPKDCIDQELGQVHEALTRREMSGDQEVPRGSLRARAPEDRLESE